MFRLIQDIRRLVALANDLSAKNTGDAPRWSVFVTNRSFIVLVVAVLLNLLTVAGVPIPGFLVGIVPEVLADHLVEVVTLLLGIWAALERLYGKTRVVWNRQQAVKAVEEAHAPDSVDADKLTEALAKAGVEA